MKKIAILLMVFVVLLVGTKLVHAQDGLKLEITPYAWFMGIDGDVSVGDRTAEVDIGFSDLIDSVDLAGSFLTVAQYNRWVFWGQLDYFSQDTDKLDNSPDIARVEIDTLIVTTAVGYQFDGFVGNSTIDALVGARFVNMDTELAVKGLGSRSRDRDLVDAVLVLRPSFQLMDNLRFNPTLSIGTGDSELTWELQPQLQYQFSENIAGRIGYRRLFYNIEGERAEFDGAFHGLIAGVGITF